MQPYLVLFRDWDPTLGQGDRAEWVDQQSAATEAQVRGLRAWVSQKGLDAELARVSPATIFGSVGIIATKALAARLRRWNRVKAVVPGHL
jgi:hypothetical protein